MFEFVWRWSWNIERPSFSNSWFLFPPSEEKWLIASKVITRSYKQARESVVMGGCCSLTRWHKAQCEKKWNVRGPPCINVVCAFISFLQKIFFWNWLIWTTQCWNLNSAQSRWYYKFAIWGTIHYYYYYYYCITLTLVTVTKLCFKMRKEMLKGNI